MLCRGNLKLFSKSYGLWMDPSFVAQVLLSTVLCSSVPHVTCDSWSAQALLITDSNAGDDLHKQHNYQLHQPNEHHKHHEHHNEHREHSDHPEHDSDGVTLKGVTSDNNI